MANSQNNVSESQKGQPKSQPTSKGISPTASKIKKSAVTQLIKYLETKV